MATLEVAADELVRKLKSVDDEVEEAHERFTSLKEQVSSLGDQVDQDWVELAKAVAELTEKAQEEHSTLGRETQEGLQALSQLDGTGQSAEQAAETGLQAAEDGTNGFADGVRERGPQVESLVTDAAEKPLEALGDHADEVAGQLEDAFQAMRDFAVEVTTALQAMQEEVTDRFDEMRTTLTEECTTALQTAYDDWSSKLDEVLGTVDEDGFQAAAENGQEVVEWALTECATAHEQEFDRLMEVAGVVQEALRTLKDDVGECGTDVGSEGRGALDQAMNETQQALTGMFAALDACRQTLASYTFVQM